MFLVQADRLILAAVLLAAGALKATRPGGFEDALRSSRLPEALVRPFVHLVPLVEISFSVLLLAAGRSLLPYSFALASGLLVAFVGWTLLVLRRHLVVACSCFASAETPVGVRSLLRTTGLAMLAAAGAASSLETSVPALASAPWGLLAVAAAALASLLVSGVYVSRGALILTSKQLERATNSAGVPVARV